MENALRWWQEEVVYQIVVPSFFDTNQDGLGDLPGILQRLDYLQWLGVGAIWLSPIYPSPLADLGYDISDYRDIHPKFGTLNDFDELLQESHRRGIRVILDWVPNHTSTEHPWFQQSSSSRDHPRRDWYIWHDPKPDGSPPNNWLSMFGGGAWQWHQPTGQYYLHTFLDKQADLNWRNPEVEEAMLDTLRFWLDRGVDGFRVDALDLVLKDEQLRDNPPNPEWEEGGAYALKLFTKYTRNQPGLHDLAAKLRKTVDQYPGERMLCGEMYVPVEEVVKFYGQEQPELHLPHNLGVAWVEWTSDELVDLIQEYLHLLPADAWPTWTFNTHDGPRLADRVEGDQTRVAAMMLLTLGGTPTLYYGEEIGMRGVPIPPEEATDPQGRLSGRNRDPERTPMQWNTEPQAGFTDGKPWLPIGSDLPRANVATQSADERSLLSLYRRLITLRQKFRALITSRPQILSYRFPILAYFQRDKNQRLLIILNRSGTGQQYTLNTTENGRLLLSTFLDREGEVVSGKIRLRGDEGVILLMD